jgi:Rho family protein
MQESDNIAMRVTIWDTYRDHDNFSNYQLMNIHQNANCYICCAHELKKDSMQSLETRLIPECRQYCPFTPLLLVETKSDLHASTSTDSAQIKPQLRIQELTLANQVTAGECHECSALTRDNLEFVFKRSFELAYNHYVTMQAKNA